MPSDSPSPASLDVRGPRFGAALTTVVLAAVLISGSGPLLAVQALVFAIGAAAGVQRSPYAVLFKVAVRPRLSPPTEFESAAPPRFAQSVGLLFAVVGLIGYFAGPQWLGMAATGCALAAAFLNAAFGYCLGCEMYLLLRRTADRTTA
ncbi:DUF4395 domain-containing protein [Streptomyces gilvosporeus]|uniref:DUF4395 domain-containing protein n=1 Tax=Streptomyces gilvosporeus TaxID=553510 RepID=A0A1V0TNL6_9ACTN|nr:DUF4395 domain-containing protein [Streptomyces gilvosporeus]ARF54262.1 hypothetical protein B1H19_08680 [Streptomyces gilvosporeus]